METPALYKREVGNRLRLAIEAKCLSQREVADVVGVSTSRLGHWIQGRHFPQPFQLRIFCDRYNITMDWIYRAKVAASMDRPLEDALWKAAAALPVVLPEEAAQVPAKRGRKPKTVASSAPSP